MVRSTTDSFYSALRRIRRIKNSGVEYYKSIDSFDRYFFLFWLIGPFILLIERSPADVWLSSIAVAFLIRCIAFRDFSFFRVAWVRAIFAFWFVCLLSAYLSEHRYFSLTEAIIWIRFPIFAMACSFWLGRDVRALNSMLAMIALGAICMCIILATEIYVLGFERGRLNWPYGDLVPGSYLAKAALPAILAAAAMCASVSLTNALPVMFLIATLAFTLLTGERINFLIAFCGASLAILFSKPKTKNLIWLGTLGAFTLFLLMITVDHLFSRSIVQFVNSLPISPLSGYYKTIAPGFFGGLSEPILGHGPATFELVCDRVLIHYPALECNPHPHHFLTQLFFEVGILGVCFGSFFMSLMVLELFNVRRQHSKNFMVLTAWIVPLAFFWPIATTADFFGQWNNTFLWTGLGFALAVKNIKRV